MLGRIRLGRILGVEIALHYSWFLIALLLVFSLAGHVRHVNPAWSTALAWGTAAGGAILFFVALLAHEMAHSLVARSQGLPVRSITLFALGGVSDIGKEPADPRTEFWMAIVGPITSFVIGTLAFGLAFVLGWTPAQAPASPLLVIVTWLGYINVGLALFNLVPGFPLDGGRVLRALAWWATGDGARATRIATRAGQVVAVGFMVLGIIRFFGGAGVHGLWMVFIGWFLLGAASATRSQSELTSSLGGQTVGDVMSRDCPTIDARTTVQSFVDDHVLRTGRRCFVVVDDGTIVGIITPIEVKDVERAAWKQATVSQAMRPLAALRAIAPEAPLADAIEVLERDDLNQLPVTSGGRLVGVLTRGHLMRFLQVRSEIGA